VLGHVLSFSVKHRHVVLLLTLLVAGIGVHMLGRLPIDAVPDITNNQVQINTGMTSLSPVEIERQVTLPIETALSGIPGLSYTRSLSRNGFSQVTAVFDDAVDIYFARSQVNERLGEAREHLPAGADPRMGPIATGLGEVYMWTVSFAHPDGEGAEKREGRPGWQPDGSYLTPEGRRLRTDLERAAYLRTVEDWIIRPQIKTVRDVADVDVNGGYVKQYQVQPDPMKLVAHGLTFHDVIEALERNNVSAGAGYVEHNGESWIVRAAGRIEREGEIGDIVVGVSAGTPVRVRDVAAFGVGRELRTGAASRNGRECVLGIAMMLIGGNSRTVAADVDAKLKEVRKTLPPDVQARTVLNRSKLVDATIHTVRMNLSEGAILVVVVLLLLLGNVRAALLTACAIPLSMLLTAIGMVATNTSGNLMSLGAIDFGLIVDGAVIVVENTLRRLAARQHDLGRPLDRAERLAEVTDAAREVVRPSAFGQAIIILVYLPILSLTGVEGKMFRPMAITVVFALAAAFLLSLTFVPAMAATLLGGRIRERESILVRGVKRLYGPTLRTALRLRWAVVGAGVAAFAGSLLLFGTLGQEFVPTLDETDIDLQTHRIPSTSLTEAIEMQQDLERTLSRMPEVALVFSKIGTAEMATDPMPPAQADTFVMFRPRAEWPDPRTPKEEMVSRVEAAARQVPGGAFETTQPIEDRFNELIAGVRADVAVKVFGDDFERIVPAADAVARVLARVPGAVGVKVEQTEGLPVLTVKVDRAAISRYGLAAADVQDVVTAAVGGREAGEVFEGDRRFDLVVRLPDDVRRDMRALAELPIPISRELSAGGGEGLGARPPPFVPLSTVASIDVSEGPNQVSRENGKRRVVVQANVRGRDLGGFVEEAKAAIDRDVKLPAGSWVSWGGQFENLEAARARLAVVVPACFLLIFVLLFATFGNARHAVMVFSGVPLALTGGVVALWLRDMPFSISAGVGFIALSGVAVLNGLVMITFINHLRGEGRSLEDAILTGSLSRLRPVVMTALVASLGFVPMAIATGTGAEVQRPLATVVIGGIVSSTLLTLVLLPALYRIWHPAKAEAAAADKGEIA